MSVCADDMGQMIWMGWDRHGSRCGNVADGEVCWFFMCAIYLSLSGRVWLVVSGYRWWLNFFSNCFGVVSVVCSWLFDWRDYVKAKDTLVQGLCSVVVIVLDL